MKKITLRVAKEIIAHESIVRMAYKDSVGVVTWGVGLTSMSGHKVERYLDNPQPMKRCIEVFAWVLENNYLPSVLEAFKNYPLTEEQLGAALSFHWNTGAIRKATWVKEFKAGKVSDAKKSFMNYRKPKEIIPRRQKERDLFFNGKWSAGKTVTEITRVSKSYAPIWSSSKKVNIDEALQAAFKIGKANNTPKIKETSPTAKKTGILAAIVAFIINLFKGMKK